MSFGSARSGRRHLLVLLSSLASIGDVGARAGDTRTDEMWRVLVLTADVTSPTNVEILENVRRTLERGATRPIEVLVESLDEFRFPFSNVEAETTALLRKKYAGTRLDLIVALGNVPYGFLTKHRDEIWPRVEVVAAALRREWTDAPPPLDGARLLVLDLNIAATLELALATHPATKHVAVVAGTGSYETRWREQMFAALHERSDRVEVTDLTRRSVADMEAGVRTLPTDSIVLFFPVTQVPSGVFPGSPRVARRLAKASIAPMYSPLGSALGAGPIGGVVPDLEEHARAAGKLALDVLSGKDAPPIQTIPQARCMVDARALIRWGVDEARLPVGCEIRFAPSSWLERNWGSLLVVLVLAIQVALIVLIVMFRRRSRHTERELERQREAVAHTARLATVGELVASITHEINQPLGTIRANVESAELLIDSQRSGWVDELRATLADIRRDDQRAAAVISHIRTFLRRNERQNTRVDLNQVVRNTVKLVSVDAQRRGVRIETDLGKVPLLVGDPVQLEQVLLNLVLNGMDAMLETPVRERVLHLSTRHNGSGQVDVRVSDCGHGLPAGDEAQLFEPFFTTKARGMGLGLSISRAIVEAHGGLIHAENHGGAGATVTVSLPELADVARPGLVVSPGH